MKLVCNDTSEVAEQYTETRITTIHLKLMKDIHEAQLATTHLKLLNSKFEAQLIHLKLLNKTPKLTQFTIPLKLQHTARKTQFKTTHLSLLNLEHNLHFYLSFSDAN